VGEGTCPVHATRVLRGIGHHTAGGGTEAAVPGGAHRLAPLGQSLPDGSPGLPGFEHVAYVNLRGTLTTGPGYKKLWDNEMHPTRQGFQRVTEKIASALQGLTVR
jgi:hypothetical protein